MLSVNRQFRSHLPRPLNRRRAVIIKFSVKNAFVFESLVNLDRLNDLRRLHLGRLLIHRFVFFM